MRRNTAGAEPNMFSRLISLYQQDVLGSHACHCHLSELHLARETRVGNAVDKVNRWARERASVGPEAQRPPRGSAWVWQGTRKVGLGRIYTLRCERGSCGENLNSLLLALLYNPSLLQTAAPHLASLNLGISQVFFFLLNPIGLAVVIALDETKGVSCFYPSTSSTHLPEPAAVAWACLENEGETVWSFAHVLSFTSSDALLGSTPGPLSSPSSSAHGRQFHTISPYLYLFFYPAHYHSGTFQNLLRLN